MLVVEVNGDRREVAAGSTVATLIEELGLHPRAVAVEYNGEILKRTAYADTLLAQGDRLEIVRFVQGGKSSEGSRAIPLRTLSFADRAAIVPVGQGPLAQLVEQQTLNLRVRGSIPWRLTNDSSARLLLSNSESVGFVAGAARERVVGTTRAASEPTSIDAKVAEWHTR